MKIFVGILMAVAALGVGGCRVHGHGHVHGSVVVIPVGHVHSVTCGHYYHNGHWYHSRGHRHGPGCGHKWSSGRWVFVGVVKAAPKPGPKPVKVTPGKIHIKPKKIK